MRALIQRVAEASVTSDGTEVGRIGAGLCVLIGVTHSDDESMAPKMADKLWNLRLMDDAEGVMNVSVSDTTGELLLVSQFTLYGDARKGRRPGYTEAARPEQAEPIFHAVVAELEALGATVATGRFRTEMQVSLVNDGPVTLMIEL
ncbi:MAG: D-tyrosyl-tRNA(Tyr) deacylase [Acidimicrobiales bacterium]|nr:D-tyrosyl-tRNA(Tyr) deacylase [Acidimicrobiales bacterium]RZV47274.1 MAG: D-tyrosyl-tRNA(Tyr) deacylase [Acidimicrobiales bacterium]